MNTYRFILDESPKKFNCPTCGEKRFVRFVDTANGNQYLPIEFGRCDRQDHCTYFVNPYKTGYAKEIYKAEWIQNNPFKTIPMKTAHIKPIPQSYVADSMKPAKNELLYYIRNLAGLQKAKQVKEQYKIGTHKSGAAIYWLIDEKGLVRTGKIMHYKQVPNDKMLLKTDIKRVKEANAEWVHKEIGYDNPPKCLFGQHLLKDNKSEIVAIFEAEKTAIIASIYLPDFICLATGGAENFNRIFENAACLKGRKIKLYPDLLKYDAWNTKAKGLKSFGIDYTVTRYLEEKATPEEREQGLDLADYFLRVAPPVTSIQNTESRWLSGRSQNTDSPLEKMIAKNPAIKDLIKVFDLVPLN